MNKKLSIEFQYLFDAQKQLFLEVKCIYNEENIPLTLSTFMQFLYEHENEMDKAANDFCYRLARLVKKVDIAGTLYYAIPSDYDMGLFFQQALDTNIPLYWKKEDSLEPIKIGYPLPLQIEVKHKGQRLLCTLLNRQEWLDDPLMWQVYRLEEKAICFSQGVILSELSKTFDDFIDQFLDKETIILEEEAILSFIQTIYTPNKNHIYWQVQADFDAFIPQETTPEPLLTVTYENGCLNPILQFQYADMVILPDEKEDIILDKNTGKKHARMPEMEAIYQQDLMTLFTEYELPFLLQSPGDIARFMDKVVQQLMNRGWLINADVPQFKVIQEPVNLEFNINSSGHDWFFFEPNCSVLGQNMNLQEIAKLMVQNQGYLKTKQGYVKVDKESQKELQALAEMNAFKVGKQFSKAEILPLMSVTSVQGKSDEAQNMISKLKSINSVDSCQLNDDFKGTLRDYQKYGVNWMYFLSMSGLGGILADDMGLGKTVQTLAFSTQLKGDGPILVIGPTNVIYNWKKEIEKFTPGKKALVYTGGNRKQYHKTMFKNDYIITSFGLIKNDIEIFKTQNFKAIFVDEAQYMKNPKAQISQAVKELKADFRLAMSGTPIENHMQDLWNLVDFVMPNYLGPKSAFDKALGEQDVQKLKNRIKPFILRREKREVLDSLPEKTEIVLKCELSDAQLNLYKTVLEATKKGIKTDQGKREKMNMLTSLLKLRQVCIHPGLLSEFQDTDFPSAKFDLIKEKITELMAEGHKVTLFSQFTKMLTIIETWTKSQDFYTERIDGSVTGKSRMNAVERFQNHKGGGLFLISLKAGGVGINLTSADYVIHTDPWWNPAIEAQATDRVHRMGQKNKVIVYKFIAQGTIEEKIQDLQDTKRALLSKVVDLDNLNEEKIDLDEVKSLILS